MNLVSEDAFYLRQSELAASCVPQDLKGQAWGFWGSGSATLRAMDVANCLSGGGERLIYKLSEEIHLTRERLKPCLKEI